MWPFPKHFDRKSDVHQVDSLFWKNNYSFFLSFLGGEYQETRGARVKTQINKKMLYHCQKITKTKNLMSVARWRLCQHYWYKVPVLHIEKYYLMGLSGMHPTCPGGISRCLFGIRPLSKFVVVHFQKLAIFVDFEFALKAPSPCFFWKFWDSQNGFILAWIQACSEYQDESMNLWVFNFDTRHHQRGPGHLEMSLVINRGRRKAVHHSHENPDHGRGNFRSPRGLFLLLWHTVPICLESHVS